MRVAEPTGRPTEPLDPGTFTGTGTLVRMAGLVDVPKVNAYLVGFAPGTRTDWHSHSGLQLLVVTEGRCRVQLEGEPPREVGVGAVIAIEPGERHWHGASADAPMTHLALNVDAATTWFEKVTDAEYAAD